MLKDYDLNSLQQLNLVLRLLDENMHVHLCILGFIFKLFQLFLTTSYTFLYSIHSPCNIFPPYYHID